MCVDSTSRSAYGDSLADIKWGRNKDRLPLEQTLEVVVYSLEPYANLLQDSPQHPRFQERGDDTHRPEPRRFPKVILVTDRGYESLANLERYIFAAAMIMCVKVRQSLVMERSLNWVFCGRPEG